MKITPLVASRFVTDGGTMFGLVPKAIWSRAIPPDEQNGIPQNANILLVECEDGTFGLIDTGCGDPARFDERALRLHGLSSTWPLMDALRAGGVDADQISFVTLTHLHWDHAGGLARIGPDGTVCPSFPHATVYIHEQEWADATGGDPLLYKSYPPETIDPLRAFPKERIRLLTDDAPDVRPGIRLLRSSGHTRGHCVIEIESDGLELDHPDAAAFGPLSHLLFTGDVCPTRHHLRMVYQTSYDTYPLDTRQWKREWLPRVANESIALFFDHDPEVIAARIVSDERREFVTAQTLPVRSD